MPDAFPAGVVTLTHGYTESFTNATTLKCGTYMSIPFLSAPVPFELFQQADPDVKVKLGLKFNSHSVTFVLFVKSFISSKNHISKFEPILYCEELTGYLIFA